MERRFERLLMSTFISAFKPPFLSTHNLCPSNTYLQDIKAFLKKEKIITHRNKTSDIYWEGYHTIAFSCIFLVELNSFISPSQKSLWLCPFRGAAEWARFSHSQDHIFFLGTTYWRSFYLFSDIHDINWWRRASFVKWFIHFTGPMKVIWTTMNYNSY